MAFSQLDIETQVNRLTTPMLVSVAQNPDDETKEMVIRRHDRFLQLPEKIKDKLASVKTSQKIQSIGKKYGFELLRLANITRLVREYYFGEVRLEDFPREIEKRMSVSLLTAQEISRYLKQEIIDWDPWAEFLASLPKLPIREILKKYPKIGDQQITDGFLEFKNQPDDIFDGTIHNWLQDYVFHLGQVGHTNIDRTNFLFHSENTKDLASTEREKLAIILKSFDENIPLPVDTENNEIIFDVTEGRDGASKVRPFGQGPTFPSSGKPSDSSRSDLTQESFIKPYSRTETRAAAPNSSFIKPYPVISQINRPLTKIKTPTQNIDKGSTFSSPDVTSGDSPRSNLGEMHFVNPYPQSGTHNMPDWKKVRDAELADEKSVASLDHSASQREVISSESGSPLVVKGMTSRQNISSEETPPKQNAPAPRKIFSLPEEQSPQQYTHHHKKNFYEPMGSPQFGEASSPRFPSGEASRPEPRIEGNIVDLKGDGK